MGDENEERQAKYKKLKLKLANALCCTPFCCLCLNPGELFSLNKPFYLKTSEFNDFVTMKLVMERLFLKKIAALASNHICSSCKDASLTTYIFLLNTEQTFDLIEYYVNTLDKQVLDANAMIADSNNDTIENIGLIMRDPEDSIESSNEGNVKKDLDEKLVRSSNKGAKEESMSEDESNEPVQKYECNICGKILKTKQSIRKHMIIGHVKRPKRSTHLCPECKDNDCAHRRFLEPVEKQKEKTCIDCYYVCRSKIGLISHVNKEHLYIQPFMCELCAKPLHSLLAYRQHARSFHTAHFVCPYCEREFTKANSFEAHTDLCKETLREFKCDQCNASFDTSDKLSLHMKKHETVLPCDSCHKVFSSESSLSRHNIMHFRNLTRRKITNICTICHAEFNTRKELKEHMSGHDDDEKHCCLHCQLEFDTAKEYRTHITKASHTDKAGFSKPFNCTFCDYVARAEFVLEAHINRYHLKQAPYECTECGMRFTTPFNLKCHAKVHKRVLQKKYTCSYCDKVLCGPTALKKHIRIHTGERPYRCETCGEGFISSSILNMHQKARHGEKNIKCPLCPMMFCTLSYMRTHVRKKHWKSNEKFDIRKIEGLSEEQYDMFRDRRQLVLE